MFPSLWKWETWQKKLFNCGHTWPPITLPCGGIGWQQHGQETAETFFPACLAAKVNKSSNQLNLCLLVIWVATTDLLWQQHRVGLMSSHTRNKTSLTFWMHVHESLFTRSLFYSVTKVGLVLLKQSWSRTVCSLWHDHVGKSWPKCYPVLKLTWIALL